MSVGDQGVESFEAILREIATSAIEQYEGMPARMDFALQSAKTRRAVRPILTLRSGLVQYMGAAYFLRDRARFRAAAAAFASHSQVIAETFAPEPFILVPDLCLALLGGPAKTRRVLVQTVWKQDSEIKPSDYSGQLAAILASLADLNRETAVAGIARLRRACRDRQFDRLETRYLLTWLLAARQVSCGAAPRIARLMHMLDRRNAGLVRHELGRLARGGSSAITAASLLDLPSAALGALGSATLPSAERLAPEPGSYADYRWIAEAAWG